MRNIMSVITRLFTGVQMLLSAACGFFLPLYSYLPIESGDILHPVIPDESSRVEYIVFSQITENLKGALPLIILYALMVFAAVPVLYIRDRKVIRFAQIISAASVAVHLLIAFVLSASSTIRNSVYLQFGSFPDRKETLESGFLPALLFSVGAFIAACCAKKLMAEKHPVTENTDAQEE